MKIPWYVYAVVGGAMIYILSTIDNEKFLVFNYVAYVFLVVAVAKLLIGFMVGGKRKELEPKLKPEEMPAQEKPKARFICKYCKSPLPPEGRFCPYCGARVRI